MSIALTGNDSPVVKNRPIVDLADGDCASLDAPNNLADGKKGKNGNGLISYNATGEMTTLTIRTLLGSPDDKFFNKELSLYRNNRPGYILMDCEIVKRVGDGNGNVSNIVYTMDSGFISKLPVVKENVEGDTEQGVAIYTIVFLNTDRGIS